MTTVPGTATTSLQRGFAAALVDPSVAPPLGLTAWNGSDPAQRFNVYRNNVMASLIRGLATAFPVVQQLVGEAFFAGMAGEFVRSALPRSAVLAGYGSDFPGFIERFEPAASLPYLPDVARLEAARVVAYHAADAAGLDAADFAALPQDRIADLIVTLHPSVQVVVSDFAIVSLWSAHHGGPDLADVDPAIGEAALICRPGDDVLVLALAPGMAEALQALGAGHPIGQAILAALESAPDFEPARLFHTLISSAAVTDARLPEAS